MCHCMFFSFFGGKSTIQMLCVCLFVCDTEMVIYIILLHVICRAFSQNVVFSEKNGRKERNIMFYSECTFTKVCQQYIRTRNNNKNFSHSLQPTHPPIKLQYIYIYILITLICVFLEGGGGGGKHVSPSPTKHFFYMRCNAFSPYKLICNPANS